MKISEAVMRPANFDAAHLSTPLDAPGAFPYVTAKRRSDHEIPLDPRLGEEWILCGVEKGP